MISFESIDLTWMDIIRREFVALFGECESNLYVIIFNEANRKNKK